MTMNEMLARYNELAFGKMMQMDEECRNLMEGRMMECYYLIDAFYPDHPSREMIIYKGREIYGYPI